MSKYIRKRKIDTNECPNICSCPIYSNIQIYASHSVSDHLDVSPKKGLLVFICRTQSFFFYPRNFLSNTFSFVTMIKEKGEGVVAFAVIEMMDLARDKGRERGKAGFNILWGSGGRCRCLTNMLTHPSAGQMDKPKRKHHIF